jgi:hypothetical protein
MIIMQTVGKKGEGIAGFIPHSPDEPPNCTALTVIAVPKELFQEILRLIDGLRPRPALA